MVNSTAVGGGVAEILNRLVPLARELDVNIRWEVLKAAPISSRSPRRFTTRCTESPTGCRRKRSKSSSP
jgi:hypothetical protein